MDIKPIKSSSMNNKNKWSKRISKDGISKEIEVEEVENGFIITKTKEWDDKKEGWQYECKKYISTENPLKDEAPKDQEEVISEMLAYFE